jgi:tetratricopeptide (TPR) repeat protein
VIDDAHWLDRSSAELFGYLMRRPPIGVLVLATWNDESFEGFDLAEASVQVSLPPWSRADVAEALIALGHPQLDPAEVHRRTGGNPRLLVEFCLASGSPATSASGALDEMMAHRLDGAGETTRQILSATAVVGTVADPTLIRLVSGRDELEVVEALEDAVARGLLVEDFERVGYDFPYDSLRDMVSRRLGLARRRLLNGRAADALVRQFSAEIEDVPAARVARHLADAGREDEARGWYWSAAQRSSALYAHREALGHLEAALALGYESSLVHAAAGEALIRLGEYRQALTAYEKAAAAIDLDDWESLALVEHKLAEVHDRLGEWDVARAHLESASDVLDPHGSPAMRAQVRADLALVMQRQGEAGAEVVALAALDLAEESSDPLALSQAHNVLGMIALERGQVDESERHLTTSSELASTAQDVALQVASLNNLAHLLERRGSVDLGLDAATEALELGIRHGDRHRIAALHDHRADLLHQAGREDEAMWHQKQAAANFADVDQAQGRPEVWKLVSW